MQAEGTTLGADNGIGVATALALLDMPLDTKLPPLECLFTVDEETGLTGAFDLDANMLSGTRAHTPYLLYCGSTSGCQAVQVQCCHVKQGIVCNVMKALLQILGECCFDHWAVSIAH